MVEATGLETNHMKDRRSLLRVLLELSLALSVVAALEVLSGQTVFLSYLFFLPSMWIVTKLNLWAWSSLWHGVVLYSFVGFVAQSSVRQRTRRFLPSFQVGLACLILVALCDLAYAAWIGHLRDPIYPSRAAIIVLVIVYLPVVIGLSLSAFYGWTRSTAL